MPGPVLFGASGQPEPSPEIQRRLQAIHPDLHLRFVESVNGFWAVCMTLDRNDARWERVQTGQLSVDVMFDIVGYLPMDCSVSEAPPYLERMLRTFPSDEVKKVAEFVTNYNMSSPVAQAAEQAMAEVLDMADPSQTSPKRKRSK